MSGRQTDRNGLSASARSLVRAARDADAPKPEDRERVRRALAVAIAASAGTAGVTASAAGGAKAIASATASSGAAATGVASAATASVVTKVAIAIVALGIGSGAIVAANHYATQARTEATEADVTRLETPSSLAATDGPSVADHAGGAPVLDLPSEIEAPGDVVPALAAPEQTPATLAPTHRPHVARAAADDDVSTLDAENVVLRDALGAATPERRLASVDEHAERFPNGQLAAARDGRRRVAVRDLCAEGPEAVARYLSAHPRSSSATLLRETCGSSH